MQKSILALSLILSGFLVPAQTLMPYQIYNSKGKKVSYNKMMKNLNKANIVLFGELHNNAISHWLQYEVTASLSQNNSLTLGAEMFEADNQEPLTAYLNGEIDDKGLDTLARLWKNYNTDYKPLVDLAKKNQFPFIATNIPRRYASMVYKNGLTALDTLTDIEKSWMMPLPLIYDSTLECYVNIVKMSHGHGGQNLPKAQAVKDATMAHFILKNYNEESLFIHYNGSYHSDNYQSILWYLKFKQPNLNYKTITTKTQAEVNKLNAENKNVADYIIVVDENMTNTY